VPSFNKDKGFSLDYSEKKRGEELLEPLVL